MNIIINFQNIQETGGFLQILKKVSECEVPLVFHSAELDLQLTLKQFFVDSLPPTLSEFKTLSMEQFPAVFDTLLMARTPPLKNHFINGHSLGEIYKKCQEQETGTKNEENYSRTHCLTPTLSEFEILNNSTLIIKN